MTSAGVGWAGPNWAVGLPAKLHDFVKTALIQQLVSPLATVCDLFCGSGTDTAKWAQAGIGCYVGVDSSASALEDAHEQWDNHGKPYPATFCEQDPCMGDLQNHLKDKGIPFDLVCCLGHLQDCFSDEDMAKHLLQNVAALLKPGGFFFGTTPDSSTIWIKYQKAVEGAIKSGSLRANGTLPRVRSELYSISFEDDRFSPFGTKYQLRFGDDGLAAQTQLLVHFPSLIRLAEECDLEYIEIQNLLDFYEDCRITSIDDLRNSCGTLLDAKGRLPNQAHDILSLYATFVFRKACPYPSPTFRTPPAIEDNWQNLSLNVSNDYYEDISPVHHQDFLDIAPGHHQPNRKMQRLAYFPDELPGHLEITSGDYDEGIDAYNDNKVEKQSATGASKRNRSPGHLSNHTDGPVGDAAEICSKNEQEAQFCVAGQRQSGDVTICTLSTFSPGSPYELLEQDLEKKNESRSRFSRISDRSFNDVFRRETAHRAASKYYLNEDSRSTQMTASSFADSRIPSLVEEEGLKSSSHISISSWQVPPRRHRSSRSSLHKPGQAPYPEQVHYNAEIGGSPQSKEMFEQSQRQVSQRISDIKKHEEEVQLRGRAEKNHSRVQTTARVESYDLYSSSRLTRYSRRSLPSQSQLEAFQLNSSLPSLLGPGPSKALQPRVDHYPHEHDDDIVKLTSAQPSRIHQKDLVPANLEAGESRESSRSRGSSLHNASMAPLQAGHP